MQGGQFVKVRVSQNEGEEVITPFVLIDKDPNQAITIEDGFKTIKGKYTTLWTFNAETQEWLVYQPDLPEWVPTFDTLRSGQGYWVEVSEDCTLNYSANTWNLKKCWNLIGWLS